MAKKHKHEEHVNHERWLVSYADFITLLFAFFVVMFAVSQVDTQKMGRFAESVRVATNLGPFENMGSPVPSLGAEAGGGQTNVGAGERTNANGFFSGLRVRLESKLKDSIVRGHSQVVDTQEGLIIRLRDAAYFQSGDAVLRTENISDLDAVVKIIKDAPIPIRIDGHTDPTPIRNSVFRSNWDLSGARAASVVQYLADHGMPEARLSIAGFADRRPIADNRTEEGRRQNRRVDIVLLRPQPPPAPVSDKKKKERPVENPTSSDDAPKAPQKAEDSAEKPGEKPPESEKSNDSEKPSAKPEHENTEEH